MGKEDLKQFHIGGQHGDKVALTFARELGRRQSAQRGERLGTEELIQEDGVKAFYPEVKVAITEEVMGLELRILRVLLLMAKMEVMPLIMVVVVEEPLKLLIVGLREVKEDQVIVVLLFCII